MFSGTAAMARGIGSRPVMLGSARMKLFWLLFAIDAAVALVFFYFFAIGVGDGSVSSFNIVLWLAILGGISTVMGLGWLLNANGRRGAALAMLSILAIPGVLAGLFILLLIVAQPRWN